LPQRGSTSSQNNSHIGFRPQIARGVEAPSPTHPATSELFVTQEKRRAIAPEFLPHGATRRRFWAARGSGNQTSSSNKSALGRRWPSRRHASASFGLPKRPLIDPQSHEANFSIAAESTAFQAEI